MKGDQAIKRIAVSGATLATVLLAAACGSSPSSSTFQPGGGLATPGSSSSAASTSSTSVFGFTFPAGYTVQFTAEPASARNRAVINALEEQQAAFRYSLYVKHRDGRYLQWTAAESASSFQQVVQMARAGHWAESGTVQYTNIKLITPIYSFPSGSGTSGTFCVAAAGVRDYSATSGKEIPAIMPAGPYQFSMHKDPGGGWKVAAVQKGEASSCAS